MTIEIHVPLDIAILRSRLNHTNWVAIVTPTDHPKSVSNRCVTEDLVAVLCCHVAFWIWVGVGAIVIGLS